MQPASAPDFHSSSDINNQAAGGKDQPFMSFRSEKVKNEDGLQPPPFTSNPIPPVPPAGGAQHIKLAYAANVNSTVKLTKSGPEVKLHTPTYMLGVRVSAQLKEWFKSVTSEINGLWKH